MMNKTEKLEFVESLTETIQRKVVDAIAEEKIPEEWDGIELRWYLAELFARSASFGNKGRRARYNNTVAVNDL